MWRYLWILNRELKGICILLLHFQTPGEYCMIKEDIWPTVFFWTGTVLKHLPAHLCCVFFIYWVHPSRMHHPVLIWAKSHRKLNTNTAVTPTCARYKRVSACLCLYPTFRHPYRCEWWQGLSLNCTRIRIIMRRTPENKYHLLQLSETIHYVIQENSCIISAVFYYYNHI